MSTTEYQQQISRMVAALTVAAPDIALRMGQTGLTLVKERNINEGLREDGTGSFAEYSTKEVYKSSFKTKARNAAGSAYASSGGKGTWGGFRAAQGLKSDHVNGFYSGRTWTALRIVSQTQNGYQYSVLTGLTDQEAAQRMASLLKRHGNFLTLTDAEVRTIQQDAADDVTDIVNQYL